MTEKSLDRKLQRILADPSCGDFILADAKDADMATGLEAPGPFPHPERGRYRLRSLQEYRELIRENVAQGLVDIMLMSASTSRRSGGGRAVLSRRAVAARDRALSGT